MIAVPRTATARLAGSMRSACVLRSESSSATGWDMPARRTAAFTRERNSRMENGLVM